jgi:hypothetical protein
MENLHGVLEAAAQWISKTLHSYGIPPQWVMAALIMMAGLAVALLGRHLARRIVARSTAWFGRWSGLQSPGPSERLESVVGAVAYWGVLALAVMATTETLGLPVVTQWLSKVASYVPNVLAAAAIVGAGVLGARVVSQVVVRAASTARLAAAERFGRLVEVGFIVGVLLVATEQLGIEVSLLKTAVLIVLSAVLGGAALAFGLGGRQLVANILSAHFVQKAYQVGQRIRVGDVEGQILRITETAVVLETEDGETSVPARELTDCRSTLIIGGDGGQ